MSAEQIPQVDDEFVPGRIRHELLGVRLRYSKCDAGTEVPIASCRHPHYEMIYIESGEGRQHIGANLVRTSPGDVFLLPPETFHRHYDPARWSIRSLFFHVDAVDECLRPRATKLFSSGHLQRFAVPEQERARWEARFRYLLSELDDQATDVDAVRSAVRSILRNTELLSRASAGGNAMEQRRVVDAVFDYIDAHYREALSLRNVADAVHFSPAYLTDLMHRKTGRAVHQWISERRMRAARLLLAETDLSVAAIAEDVGFRDATYFGRHFAKVSGQTPRVWREIQRRRSHTPSDGFTAWNLQATHGVPGDYIDLRVLGERLRGLHTRDEIENAALEATYELFTPSLVQILRRDPARRISIVFRQLGARDSKDFHLARDLDGTLPGLVEGETVLAQDLRRSPLESHRRIGRLGYSCLLIAPIITGPECIGAIQILERKPRAFSERERALLAMISTLTGLATRGLSFELSSA